MPPAAEQVLEHCSTTSKGEQPPPGWGYLNTSQRHPSVQIVDHPVERGEVDRLDDPHVVERNVQPVVGNPTEPAPDKAGTPKRGQSVGIGPLDRPEDIWAVSTPTDRD